MSFGGIRHHAENIQAASSYGVRESSPQVFFCICAIICHEQIFSLFGLAGYLSQFFIQGFEPFASINFMADSREKECHNVVEIGVQHLFPRGVIVSLAEYGSFLAQNIVLSLDYS